MENKKRALGRGLEQLFNNDNIDVNAIERQIYETATRDEVIDINIDELRVNPYQPRKVFKQEALDELASSIKEHGIIQPIIVKKSIKGYEIVAGERRYRASKQLNLDKIPAIVRNFTDEQMMEIALLENLQRENLNAIEEASAYKQMLISLDITQEELAKKVGKSRSHVTNILGLLRLPKEVQQMVASEKLSMGHARVLSKLENPSKIIEMANMIVSNKMPVRDIENMTNHNQVAKKVKMKPREENKDYIYVENLLRDTLGTKVKVKDKKIEISFTNVADLNRLLEIMNVKE